MGSLFKGGLLKMTLQKEQTKWAKLLQVAWKSVLWAQNKHGSIHGLSKQTLSC